jgi:chemotaxis protein MotB
MAIHNNPSRFAINYWPALLDVVTAAFMVFVLATYLQLVMTMDIATAPTPVVHDIEAERERALQAQFVETLRHDLAADFAAGNLEVSQTLGRVHIGFDDHVLFAPAHYKLSEPGRELLDRFGRFLGSAWQVGVRRVQVEGHTDSVPFVTSRHARYPRNNWELSSARATAVTMFLLDGSFDFPATLISANGNASNHPIADNGSASGRARNRRVDVELVFAGEEAR